MNNYKHVQSLKILSSYNLNNDIHKANIAVPDGTISKDGKKIKRAGKWIWRRKNKTYTSRDLKVGQEFKITTNYGKQHSEFYTITGIDGDTITYDYNSEAGASSKDNKINRRDFVRSIAGGYKIGSGKIDEKINLEHVVDDEQREFVRQAIEGRGINADLDYEALPDNVRSGLFNILNKKNTPGSRLQKKDIHPTPGNIELVQELGLDSLFNDGEIKVVDGGSDVEVYIADAGFVTIDHLSEYNVMHKIELSELRKLLSRDNRYDLRATVDNSIWRVPPIPVYDPKGQYKQAFLGDYVNFYTRGAENPSSMGNVKIPYRIVKFLKNSKGKDTWILKDAKGNVRALTRDRLSDQITLDTSRKNSLLENKGD